MRDNMLPLPEGGMSLKGHTDSIWNVTVLRGGEQIITASEDKTARVFSLSTGDCVQLLRDHEADLNETKPLDDDTVVTVSDDRKVRVWRLSDGKLLHAKSIEERAACFATLGEGRLLIGGGDGGLFEMEWDGVKLTTHRTVLDAHRRWIRRIAVHNGRVATASHDQTVKLWNASTLTCVHTFTGHSDSVTCVALNDEYVVTGSADTTIRVYDANSFQFLSCINAHDEWIGEVYFAHGGNAVLSSSSDKTIAVHALRSGECLWRMCVGILIRALAVLPDGRIAAGGCNPPFPFVVHVFPTPLCDDLRQGTKSSRLATAFACAITDPSIVDETFLLDNIRAENITSAADLLAGHNLILLAIRFGILTPVNIRTFGGSSWHLKDNLYLPATKIDSNDHKLIHSILHNAEDLGIISGGHALKVAQEIRADVRACAEGLIHTIGALSERVAALESRVSTLEGNVEQWHEALGKMRGNQKTLQEGILSLSKSLTDLQTAIRSQNRNMTYASIARCLFSFIPLVGNAVGNAAYTTAEVLMNLTAEHLVPVGVDVAKAAVTELASVDFSNFQVAQYVFSDDTLSKLGAPAQNAVMQAVVRSSFQTLQSLQSNLRQHITSNGTSNPSAALLDIGSSTWLTKVTVAADLTSSSSEHALDTGAYKYFQFLAHVTGRRAITLFKAICELNHILRVSDGLLEISPERVQNLFFELSDEDDIDVSEDLFVRMFKAVREEQEATHNKKQILEECSALFQKHVHGDGSIPLLLGARLLRNLQKEIGRRGIAPGGKSFQVSDAVRELQKSNPNGERSKTITERDFLNVAKTLIN